MQDLPMSRKEENGSVEALATSGLCSNSHPSRLPGNGKGECWHRDMSKIPAAKAGNTAIPFQSDVSSQLVAAGRCDLRSIRLCSGQVYYLLWLSHKLIIGFLLILRALRGFRGERFQMPARFLDSASLRSE
jgi:hypothetical protein